MPRLPAEKRRRILLDVDRLAMPALLASGPAIDEHLHLGGAPKPPAAC